MSYDLWKTRDPNDTGFYDMPEDDGPTELDIAYQRIEALVKALEEILHWYGGDENDLSEWSDCMLHAREALSGAVGGFGK